MQNQVQNQHIRDKGGSKTRSNYPSRSRKPRSSPLDSYASNPEQNRFNNSAAAITGQESQRQPVNLPAPLERRPTCCLSSAPKTPRTFADNYVPLAQYDSQERQNERKTILGRPGHPRNLPARAEKPTASRRVPPTPLPASNHHINQKVTKRQLFESITLSC